MRKIIKDIWMSNELRHQMFDVLSADDECEVEDYADHQIVSEALYVREMFTDSTWYWYEELKGWHGKEAQDIAKEEFKNINKFIKKWLPKVPQELVTNKGCCTEPELKGKR